MNNNIKLEQWGIFGVLDEGRRRYVEICYPEDLPALAIRLPLDRVDDFIGMLNEARKQAEQL